MVSEKRKVEKWTRRTLGEVISILFEISIKFLKNDVATMRKIK